MTSVASSQRLTLRARAKPVIVHVMVEDAYGVASSESELLAELVHQGFEVHLIVYDSSHTDPAHELPRLVHAGIPIQRIPFFRPPRWVHPKLLFRVSDFVRVYKALRTTQADLVHCHSLMGFAAALLLRIQHKRPIVATFHGLMSHVNLWDGLYRLLASAADRTVVLKDVDYHAIRRIAGTARLVRLHNGIDVEHWEKEISMCTDLRSELGIPKAAFVVGLIGRVSPEKRQQEFFEALARYDWHGPVDTHVLVVGEGPSSDRLAAVSRELGFDSFVHFLGYRNDMPRSYKTLDVLVLPSLRDSQPMVVLEAMACEVPVVATAVGGIPEMLSGGAGVLVPHNRLDAIPDVLKNLRDSPKRRRQLALAGHRRVVEHFHVRDICRAYVQGVYLPLLNRTDSTRTRRARRRRRNA